VNLEGGIPGEIALQRGLNHSQGAFPPDHQHTGSQYRKGHGFQNAAAAVQPTWGRNGKIQLARRGAQHCKNGREKGLRPAIANSSVFVIQITILAEKRAPRC
jgi:hypothetical protein